MSTDGDSCYYGYVNSRDLEPIREAAGTSGYYHRLLEEMVSKGFIFTKKPMRGGRNIAFKDINRKSM